MAELVDTHVYNPIYILQREPFLVSRSRDVIRCFFEKTRNACDTYLTFLHSIQIYPCIHKSYQGGNNLLVSLTRAYKYGYFFSINYR